MGGRVRQALAALLCAAAPVAPVAPAGAQDGRPASTAQAYGAADFALLPTLQDPDLSPNGQLIAARIAVGAEQFFAIVTLDGQPPTLVRLGDVELNWWRWVGDQWLVIGVGQSQPWQGEDFYITRTFAVNASTGKVSAISPRDAAQKADDVIWAAQDGSARILLAYQTSFYLGEEGFWPQVREIDLATGRSRGVQSPYTGVLRWYADSAGTVRMGIGHGDEGRSTRVYYRPARGAPLRVIDKTKSREEDITIPALFLPDGKALVFADDEAGFTGLYDLDLATLTRGKLIASSKGYDLAGLVTDPSGSRLLGVRVIEERPDTRWLDPDLAAMAGEVASMVKGTRTRIVSVDRDHRRAIVYAGGGEAPGLYLVYNRQGQTMNRLAYVNDSFAMRRMHPVRTVRYKARDGLEIAAVLTVPKTARQAGASPLPLIVMPHGGPFARDDEQWDWWAQFLADRGYAVVQPNYRGSSGFGTPFTRKGEGQWGLAMQDDLNDAIAALAAQGIADPKRVCIVGASYGGYAAMRAAERDRGVYRCAVSYAGVSDLKAMLRYDSRFLMAGARGDWLRKQAPDLSGVSPINAIDRFTTPILLLHGAKDRTVPVRQSRNLASKLKAAGKNVTYVEQPLGDHHFSRAGDRQQFLEMLEAFLKQHNPA